MELEERIQRIRDHCEKEDLELYLGSVSSFSEDDSGWYTCSIAGVVIATEEGFSSVVDATEEYLGISEEDI